MREILIRGMEMPKSCDECRLFNESWCMALGVENWRKSYNKPPEGGRLPDCPLVPLPEGHGRLIDAENLENCARPHMRGFAGYSSNIRDWSVLVSEIRLAPTIVPAEGETTNDGDA